MVQTNGKRLKLKQNLFRLKMQDKLERFQEEIKRGNQRCPLALDANGLKKKKKVGKEMIEA